MLHSADDIIHITQTHTQCMLRVLGTAVRVPEIKVIETDAFLVNARDIPQLVANPPVTPVTVPDKVHDRKHNMVCKQVTCTCQSADTGREKKNQKKRLQLLASI